MTGPAIDDAELARMHQAYLARQAPGAPRLRVPQRAAPDAAPDLPALYRQYKLQQDPESWGDFAKGATRSLVGQGVGMGGGDEIEAGVRRALPLVADDRGRSYGEIRDDIRAANTRFSEHHTALAPSLELAGNIASAFVPMGAAARATTAAGRIGRAMKVGGVIGAASGFGHAEGDALSQATSTAVGAGMGIVGGGVTQGLIEAPGLVSRAYDLSPKVLKGASDLVPDRLPGIKARVADAAQRAHDKVVDRMVLERLQMDAPTAAAAARMPETMARTITDAPEHIPVAVVDAAGENSAQQLAALKRLPGPQKAEIATTAETRKGNAPGMMRRTIRRNMSNDADALGLTPRDVDTRTTNANTVTTTAREALSARSGERYRVAMQGPGVTEPDAVGRLHNLMDRDSMKEAVRYGESVAREDGTPITLTNLTEAPPVFDEAGNVAVPARELHGAKVPPPAKAASAPAVRLGAKPVPGEATAKPGTKLGDLLDAAENGGDVAPPSSADLQGRFYRELSDDALAKQWQRETTRIVQEGQRHAEGQWVRQTDDGRVVSGGSRSGGRAKKMGDLAQARLARVEGELKRRGFTDDHVNALWGDAETLPPRAGQAAPAGAAASPSSEAGASAGDAGPGLETPASVQARTPSVRQMHYMKVGLDRHIAKLKAEVDRLQGSSKNESGPAMLLRAAMKTRDEFLGVLHDVAPDYETAMGAHALEAEPISAFTKGRKISPTAADPEDVETYLAGLKSDRARDAAGAGYGKRLQREVGKAAGNNANPVKAVLGSGSEDADQMRKLRLLVPKAASGIQREGALIDKTLKTNATVLANSATAERLVEQLRTATKIGEKAKILAKFAGRPLEAIHDVLSGEYGPAAEDAAKKLLLGAKPGERPAAVGYLRQLQRQLDDEASRRAGRTVPRLRTGRPVGGSVGGGQGGKAAALRER